MDVYVAYLTNLGGNLLDTFGEEAKNLSQTNQFF